MRPSHIPVLVHRDPACRSGDRHPGVSAVALVLCARSAFVTARPTGRWTARGGAGHGANGSTNLPSVVIPFDTLSAPTALRPGIATHPTSWFASDAGPADHLNP